MWQRQPAPHLSKPMLIWTAIADTTSITALVENISFYIGALWHIYLSLSLSLCIQLSLSRCLYLYRHIYPRSCGLRSQSCIDTLIFHLTFFELAFHLLEASNAEHWGFQVLSQELAAVHGCLSGATAPSLCLPLSLYFSIYVYRALYNICTDACGLTSQSLTPSLSLSPPNPAVTSAAVGHFPFEVLLTSAIRLHAASPSLNVINVSWCGLH